MRSFNPRVDDYHGPRTWYTPNCVVSLGQTGVGRNGPPNCRIAAWVVALELVVDPRDPRAGHAPTLVGLHLGRRRHDERRRLAVFGVRVVAVPVVPLGPADRLHVAAVAAAAAAVAAARRRSHSSRRTNSTALCRHAADGSRRGRSKPTTAACTVVAGMHAAVIAVAMQIVADVGIMPSASNCIADSVNAIDRYAAMRIAIGM